MTIIHSLYVCSQHHHGSLSSSPSSSSAAPLPLQLAEEERMARKGPLWEVSQVKVFKYSHWLPIVDAFEGRRKEGLSLMTVGDLIDVRNITISKSILFIDPIYVSTISTLLLLFLFLLYLLVLLTKTYYT